MLMKFGAKAGHSPQGLGRRRWTANRTSQPSNVTQNKNVCIRRRSSWQRERRRVERYRRKRGPTRETKNCKQRKNIESNYDRKKWEYQEESSPIESGGGGGT